MTNVNTWQIGYKVQGVYHEASFTGTITAIRPSYANHRITCITVKVDAPIYVYDDPTPRDEVYYECESNGGHRGNTAERIEAYTPAETQESARKPYYYAPSVQWDQAEYNRNTGESGPIVFHTKASAKAKQQIIAMVEAARRERAQIGTAHNR